MQVKPHRLVRRSSVFGGVKPLLGSHVGRVGTEHVTKPRRASDQVPISKSSLEKLSFIQSALIAFSFGMFRMETLSVMFTGCATRSWSRKQERP